MENVSINCFKNKIKKSRTLIATHFNFFFLNFGSVYIMMIVWNKSSKNFLTYHLLSY